MRVPVSWLREYVDVRRAAARARRPARRLDVRGRADHAPRRRRRGRQPRPLPGRPRARGRASIRTPTGSSSAAWTWGRASRARSSAAPGTSAPARPSPSRCPGAVLPDGPKLERAKLRGTVSDGMILSERELELGPDHERDPRPRGRARAGHAARRRPPARRRRARGRGDRRTGPTSCRSTGSRARSPRSSRARRARAAARHASPQRAGDEPVDVDGRGLRSGARATSAGSSATSTVGAVAGVAAARLAAGRDALDLERRRRDELRHARAREPAPRLRLRHARGRADRRPPRAATGRSCGRSTAPSGRLDPSVLVIADARARGRARRDHGRRGDRGDAARRPPSSSRRRTSSRSGSCGRPRRSSLRTDGSNRWEKGVDPYLAGAGRRLRDRAPRRAGGRALDRRDRRARRAAGAAGRPLPPGARRRAERPRGPAGRAARAPRAARLRGRTDDWDVDRPDLARARRDARGRRGRGGRARPPRRDPVHAAARRAMFGRLSPEQRLRRTVEDVARRRRVRRGVHVEPRRRAIPDPSALRLPEPLSAEHAVLRTTLVPGLVDAARRNVDAGNEDIALFEIARVYLPSGEELPDERWHVGGVAEGGFAAREGRRRDALRRAADLELTIERTQRAEFLHPGKAGRGAGRLGRRAAPDASSTAAGAPSSSTSTSSSRCAPERGASTRT